MHCTHLPYSGYSLRSSRFFFYFKVWVNSWNTDFFFENAFPSCFCTQLFFITNAQYVTDFFVPEIVTETGSNFKATDDKIAHRTTRCPLPYNLNRYREIMNSISKASFSQLRTEQVQTKEDFFRLKLQREGEQCSFAKRRKV